VRESRIGRRVRRENHEDGHKTLVGRTRRGNDVRRWRRRTIRCSLPKERLQAGLPRKRRTSDSFWTVLVTETQSVFTQPTGQSNRSVAVADRWLTRQDSSSPVGVISPEEVAQFADDQGQCATGPRQQLPNTRFQSGLEADASRTRIAQSIRSEACLQSRYSCCVHADVCPVSRRRGLPQIGSQKKTFVVVRRGYNS
jgi:hypothetical protein